MSISGIRALIDDALRASAASRAFGFATSRDDKLNALLLAARREGAPVAPSLKALSRVLRSSEVSLRGAERWRRVYDFRLMLGAGAALLSRVACATLLPQVHEGLPLSLDALALSTAAMLASLVRGLTLRSLPVCWAWRDGLSLTAQSWLACHLLDRLADDESKMLEVSAHWSEVKARELALGASLLPQRRELLESWCEGLAARELEALARFEDRMPLAELFGIGLPGALVLLEPLVSRFGVLS